MTANRIKVFTGHDTSRLLKLHFNSLPVCGALALVFAAGCTPSAQIPGQRQVQPQTLDVTGSSLVDLAAPSSDAEENQADSQRLEQLRLGRAHDAFSPDFSIGPGDLLRVSVPGVDELKDCEVRVSADDTITLPVTDEIHIGGLSQEGVRQAIRNALERYVKDPDVEVFVKEYQSRQVAIIGMVQKPGLYTLTSRTDSVLDMVSRAGGMTESAGNNVILVPASADRGQSNAKLFETAAFAVPQSAAVTQSAAITDAHYADASLTEKPDKVEPLKAGGRGLAQTLPIPLLAQAHPITISLGDADAPSPLAIPARPGDVIIVPAAGDVMVQGWVQNPGAFKITPGMTVLGAVTAAGGQLFSSSAEVLRTGAKGGKTALQVNLARVERREASDLPVRSGDVVIVNRSVTGAVPYLLYELFTKFGTGMYLPAP
jgi:polysaccharide biosynthesis/export protein